MFCASTTDEGGGKTGHSWFSFGRDGAWIAGSGFARSGPIPDAKDPTYSTLRKVPYITYFTL